ncbi:MAG: c-type cytochrome [Pseudomonadota bacterium]
MQMNYLFTNSFFTGFIFTNSFFTGRSGSLKLSVLVCSAFTLGLLFSNSSNADMVGEDEMKLDDIVQQALDVTPNLENGKGLFRNCAVCHSPEGWGTPNGRFPQIAGQHKSVIIKQLTDIHKGNRDNPTMLPFTAPLIMLGAQALADISAYVSQLPMVPNNSIGYGAYLDEGKKLYDDNCKQCHESNGAGKAEKFYPRIHGQHYSYLERQLHWIKNGKRRNADRKMVKQLQKFNYREIEMIADYVSRLRPEKSMLAESMYWKNPDFRTGFFTAPRD